MIKTRKLSRKSSNRNALLKNLVTSLFDYGQIITTEIKAKQVKPIAEKLLTRAQKRQLHSSRIISNYIKNKRVAAKVEKEIVPKLPNTKSGYIRMIKVSHRLGDGANQVVLHINVKAETESIKDNNKKSDKKRSK